MASPSIITTDYALLRLLQLSSPALPVGAYAFSQGLEAAIDLGWLRNPREVGEWLELQLQHSLAQTDLPLILRMHAAFNAQDYERVHHLNALMLACRESEELRKEAIAFCESMPIPVGRSLFPKIHAVRYPILIVE